jgi:hypothetical protein
MIAALYTDDELEYILKQKLKEDYPKYEAAPLGDYWTLVARIFMQYGIDSCDGD